MTEERWAWLREQTPVFREYAYMNSGWSGPLSIPVVEAMHRRLALEIEHGPTTEIAMDNSRELSSRLREVMAQLLGADSEEITITGNTTEGLNIVMNGLNLESGDGIVTTSVEHSSGIVPAYYLRERRGVDLDIVPVAVTDTAGAILERFSGALTEKSKLVVLSEISYSTGQILPLAGIVDAAHRVGALVLVDGAQTAGHIPIDVRATGVDCYAIPGHKWLCGPDGLGALYVRNDLISGLEPVKVSGRAAASYDLDGNFEPQRDQITKYELTTVSDALIAGTVTAAEQYLTSGPDAVFQRARELCRYAEERFDRISKVEVISSRAEDSRSGLFCFKVDGQDAPALSSFLQSQARVVCRSVSEYDSVRLSLNAFNTEADVDLAADTVETAISEGIPEDI